MGIQRTRNIETKRERVYQDLRRYDPLLNPHLRRIQEKLRRNIVVGENQLVCPECGQPDRGNTMNGKPWCFKCKRVLEPKNKGKKRRSPTVRSVSKEEDRRRQMALLRGK